MNRTHFFEIWREAIFWRQLPQVVSFFLKKRDSVLYFISELIILGLVPILFAISIDRADLNRKSDVFTGCNNEQIIVTAPMGKAAL